MSTFMRAWFPAYLAAFLSLERSATLWSLLDPLGLGELRDYIAELQTEIARVEAAIARKQGHRNAADSVFRKD